jgi:hypothetical protein
MGMRGVVRVLVRQLRRAGAVVLDQDRGVVNVDGLRVAGYSDPFMRLKRLHYVGTDNPHPSLEQQQAFAAWLRPLIAKVDVVVVHEPALAEVAIDELRDHPPDLPIAFLVGHTHVPSIEHSRNLVVLNGGTIGAGGPSNAAEHQEIGLAVLTFALKPRFQPRTRPSSDDGTASTRTREENWSPTVTASSRSAGPGFSGNSRRYRVSGVTSPAPNVAVALRSPTRSAAPAMNSDWSCAWCVSVAR